MRTIARIVALCTVAFAAVGITAVDNAVRGDAPLTVTFEVSPNETLTTDYNGTPASVSAIAYENGSMITWPGATWSIADPSKASVSSSMFGSYQSIANVTAETTQVTSTMLRLHYNGGIVWSTPVCLNQGICQ